MVAELNGHPRALQVLLQVLNSVAAANEEAKKSNPSFVAAELTFDYLFEAINSERKIIRVTEQPVEVIDAVVKACLLNEAVRLGARVLANDPSSPDFASLVASVRIQAL
jgi:pyruvate carboxylase